MAAEVIQVRAGTAPGNYGVTGLLTFDDLLTGDVLIACHARRAFYTYDGLAVWADGTDNELETGWTARASIVSNNSRAGIRIEDFVVGSDLGSKTIRYIGYAPSANAAGAVVVAQVRGLDTSDLVIDTIAPASLGSVDPISIPDHTVGGTGESGFAVQVGAISGGYRTTADYAPGTSTLGSYSELGDTNGIPHHGYWAAHVAAIYQRASSGAALGTASLDLAASYISARAGVVYRETQGSGVVHTAEVTAGGSSTVEALPTAILSAHLESLGAGAPLISPTQVHGAARVEATGDVELELVGSRVTEATVAAAGSALAEILDPLVVLDLFCRVSGSSAAEVLPRLEVNSALARAQGSSSVELAGAVDSAALIFAGGAADLEVLPTRAAGGLVYVIGFSSSSILNPSAFNPTPRAIVDAGADVSVLPRVTFNGLYLDSEGRAHLVSHLLPPAEGYRRLGAGELPSSSASSTRTSSGSGSRPSSSGSGARPEEDGSSSRVTIPTLPPG